MSWKRLPKKYVRDCQKQVWNELCDGINIELNEAARLIEKLAEHSFAKEALSGLVAELRELVDPGRRDVVAAIRKALRLTVKDNNLQKQQLINWLDEENVKNSARFNSKLFSDTPNSPLNVEIVKASYSEDSRLIDWQGGAECLF